MKINEIEIGQEVYYPRWGKRVIVVMINKQSEYVTVENREGYRVETLASHLEPITGDNNMNIDDILRREG